MKSITLIIFLQLCYIQESWEASASNETVESLLQCPVNSDFCDVASNCCMPGMDSYGWIAAAVGWGLWVFTLILICICRVMDLRPNEPKYMEA
ncbi:transmembrane protein 213 [Hyla sarda]|uniref:transmembrane protein 213 n=1 Tax=Hyla sarda TaxID=327740 RepID=UPI0024C4326B|nr:transmembrane protein 213 [Hyla sarda]XP_056373960.1 transmembrane protein 213 [Hyla sarda]XP_056373961.1 transmembrane protein 213 [Hyla sarda]